MSRAVIIVLVVLLSSRVFATGFFINQQSVKGQGRAGAGNAVAADELGTIFFNPAGLPKVVFDSSGAADWRVSAGTHVLVPRSDLRNRGSSSATPGSLGFSIPLSGGDGRDPADPTPIPNVFVAGALGNLAVGGGVTFPFGLATEYERDWHGRYDAIKASLTTTNIGLVAAYRVTPAVSIGGGVDLQRATTELETAIPNPLIPGGPTAATDASIDTEGDAFTVGFNVGAMWDVTDRVRIGAHYRSGMQHELEGTSTVRALPGQLSLLNGSIGARATIDLPSITSVGARWQAGDVSLYGQGEWYDWSQFEEVRIRFDDGRPDAVRPANYRDAYALAVGAEWPVKSRWTLRAGVRYDTTPTVGGFRDATVPDSERTWLSAGASVDLSQRLALDLSLTYAFFADTNIGVTRTFFDNTPLASRVNVNSSVETDVTTVAAGFRVRF